MNFITGMARAYNDQRNDVTRQLREEEDQRTMARMRAADAETVAARNERLSQAEVLRQMPPTYGDVPEARAFTQAGDVAPPSAAPAAPAARGPKLKTAPASNDIYAAPKLLADQTEAETQRLARARAPASRNGELWPSAAAPNTPCLLYTSPSPRDA